MDINFKKTMLIPSQGKYSESKAIHFVSCNCFYFQGCNLSFVIPLQEWLEFFINISFLFDHKVNFYFTIFFIFRLFHYILDINFCPAWSSLQHLKIKWSKSEKRKHFKNPFTPIGLL